MKNRYNLRSLAAQAISQVLEQGQSLSTVLPGVQVHLVERDRALLQELCFGTLRVLPQLEWLLQQLMEKPLVGKQRTLHHLLMVGLYQLLYTRIPAHAALAETVEGASALKRTQFKGLINGVLRQFQRQQQALVDKARQHPSSHLHPSWLLKRIQHAYPTAWQQIVAANNQKPPMWLRVNQQHHQRADYLQLLQQAGISAVADEEHPAAIRLLTPCAVSLLPGFAEGWITVQDVAAQAAVELLAPQPGEQILDLCAAPGGKTTHILELAPTAQVMAVDVDQQRLDRVAENLQRLGQSAQLHCGDGRTPQDWCAGKQFDRILLDAPCSATGVIRRHPDIKWLRRDSDIAELVQLQQQILNAIWRYLKPGGVLLYATCSILPEENSEQIATFLSQHPDAQLAELAGRSQLDASAQLGRQNLPHPERGDGFFYAKLIKMSFG
ncbi:16S rRNA (cytosine(967)-C(5))-methyltransferase RsmB [Serratia microhaemolytica]|uniref:16S rRNA (cytosine(967)-C(5))-methyltransferase RsmB n=1 Tax=Serratia microhaemolytica TaxID=2675110 RepID=UPI000FDE5BFA|nr:16S rRNA (cytosine(967)-C(5))-methyltransferase RsmB [Serratia microhaemolytica]